ncbi:hypothetical protein ACWGJB_39160 [Streptomyces sp. NPDC054813]
MHHPDARLPGSVRGGLPADADGSQEVVPGRRWAVVRRVAKNPAGLLRWLVPVLVVASFAPDLSLLGGGTPGSGPLAVAALMVMHVVVAVVAVTAYRRVLPLPVR